MGGALEGVRVVDLSRLFPGPFATQLLADFGADVIKVEQPGRGDYMRGFAPVVRGESLFFLNLNRNKRSVALDLKHPRGRDALLRLVDTADVVVESFRPGVMERLGLGPDELLARNPRLIYCAVTGYGRSGPYAQRAGHDANYLGVAGALALNRDAQGRPVLPHFQIGDVGGGALNACIGILLALVARQRTGRGQVVDAAMVDGVATWLTYRWAHLEVGTPERDLHLGGGYPCYAVYETADGRFVVLAALEPQFWERFCRHIGRPEWIREQFAGGEQRDRIFDELRSLFRGRTRDEWTRELEPVDCCASPVLEVDELADDPHWRERELVRPVEIPGWGVLRALGFPVRLSGTPASVRRPPPGLGEHTREVLTEAGLSDGEIQALLTEGAAAGA
ncbi:MAG: CoA transferase [Deltaproteobacteria bacterium]|nr:CoA transferase [Deltaproteobacteria bacterium]